MAELTGLSGNDVITGTATNDVINSGAGDDTIDGGAGSDRLNAGSGNDTLVYTLAQNTGANDLYTGGSGIDTVRLQLTADEWLNATVQNEIHRYVDFLNTVRTNANTGEVSNGTASDFTFNFDLNTRLTVSMMENLVVWVDGQNIDFHAPFITVADDAGAVTEDAATPTLSDTGTINFTDVDWSNTHTVTVTPDAGNAVGGSLVASVTNSAWGDGVGVVTWSYTASNSDTDVQRLGKDETATEKFTVKIIDSTGKEDTLVITATITGTNDAPVITVGAGDADSAGLTEANAGLTASDTLTVTDVDVTDLVNPSVVSVLTSGDTGGLTNGQLLAMMSVAPSPVDTTTTTTGQITWTFNSGLQAFDHLDDGESLTLTYTVRATDDSGAANNSDDQTVTITINGTNDEPVISVVTTDSAAESLNETNAALNTSGTLTVVDPDLSDSVTAQVFSVSTGGTTTGLTSDNAALQAMMSVTGGSINANTGDTHNISWTWDSTPQAFDYLDDGESLTLTYTVRATDDSTAFDDQSVTITINGTNDGPVISVVTTDSAAESLNETNAALNTSGTLTVVDPDLSDSVTAQVFSVSTGGTTTGLTSDNAALQAMMSVTGGSINANTGDTHNISWTWDSTPQAFDYLDDGESLTLTYTVRATDDSTAFDDQSVTITINGTNDGPVISVVTTDSAAESLNETNAALNTSGTLTVVDPDLSDSVTAQVFSVSTGGTTTGLTSDNAALQVMMSVTGGSINANTGDTHNISWTWDSTPQAFDYLDDGESLTLTYTVRATDDSTAFDDQTVTITINGTDDQPTLGAVTSGSVAEVDQSSSTIDSGLSGTLVGADVDVETLTYGISGGSVAAGFATLAGAYGTLSVNTTTGAYLYTKNAAAIEALDATETDSDVFTVTVSDGDGPQVTQTYTVNVSGADEATANDPPVSTNDSVVTNEDSAKILALTDFGVYGDGDGDPIAAVKITTLENNGSLEYDTTGLGAWTAVTLNQEISAADITAGRLRFVPDANESGSPYATVGFKVGDGTEFSASEYTLTVNVSAVNDNPVANADTLWVSNSTTVTLSLSALLGNDVDIDGLAVAVTGFSAGAGLSGFTLNGDGTFSFTTDATGGNTAAPTVRSFTYNITDGVSGTGTGSVTVNVVATAGGADTVNLSGVGTYQASYIDGKGNGDTLTDGAFQSVLIGGAGNDTLNGSDSNDILRGGNGNDVLSGGNGIDLLDFSDAVAGITLTLVQSAITTTVTNAVTGLNSDDYTNMEGIIGSLTGNDTLTGSASGDVLWGMGGTDTLNGSDGNDTLRGGAGNDSIDGGLGIGDLLDFSDATGGINFTLFQSASNTTVGAGATPGLGQDIYKNMEGVIGSSFNDSLTGSSGNDILVGGSGADTMTGAGGSDIYRFLNADASAVDTLTDFAVAPTGSGGDVLDLADVLSGVAGLAAAVAADNAGIVEDYLHFNVSGTTAIMFVDAAGTGAGEATATFGVTLGTTESSLLSDLLTNNQIMV